MWMSPSRERVGARIKQLRGGRTQQEFSDLLGVSRGYLADIERGRSYPSIPFLVSLDVNCDVSLDWLITGKEQQANLNEDAEQSYYGLPPDMDVDPSNDEEAAFAAVLAALWHMFKEGDPDLRAWVRVQLARAIPELEEVLRQKKQQAAAAESA